MYTSFFKDENGTITHVVKRIALPQKEVYETLRMLHDAHLPTIFRITEENDAWNVEYEYIKGMSMEDASDLEDDELLRVALDVTQALCCIHSASPAIIHRDIKPANIVRRAEGGYVLIDFDAAKLYKPCADRDTTIRGTEGYAPPEQFGFMQTDDRSDIYSLGATLYELKTGVPYRAGDVCPGKLGRIIKKCTAFSPEHRYRDVWSLRKTLLRVKNKFFRRNILPPLCLLGGIAIGLTLSVGAPWHAVPSPAAATSEVSAGMQTSQCICALDISKLELTAPQDGLIQLTDGVPAELDLALSAPLAYAEECPAQEHVRPQLAGVQLKRCTLGGEAFTDEAGHITITREGVYEFDAVVAFGEEYRGPISATVIAANDIRAYTDCRCVFDIYSVDYIRPTYTLPADGSPITIDLKFYTPVIDSRMCTSDVHAQLLFMPAGYLHAPEGSDVYVDENNILHASTPGSYQLDIPMWFRLSEEDSFHFDIQLVK